MKYKYLFFDLDHTLWDFDANARATLQQLYRELNLEKRGVNDFEVFHKNYLMHNDKLWGRYRNGYIRQEELRFKRMWLTLLDFQIADEALTHQLSEKFIELLPFSTLLFPDTISILEYLTKKQYQLYLITNGFEITQQNKLKNAGLSPYFKEVITSESSNSLKPHKEIYEYALQKTGATIKESLMIGDSIEVDIAGALNMGMDQVHVNYQGMAQELNPTYTISALIELKNIL
ncbi:MAG: YjjG family noncanonical pyrimidine nucleotidase [Flavisolibacter sp.]